MIRLQPHPCSVHTPDVANVRPTSKRDLPNSVHCSCARGASCALIKDASYQVERKFSTAFIFFFVIIQNSSSREANSDGTDAAEKVEVSMVRDSALRPYVQMLKGLDAWDKNLMK